MAASTINSCQGKSQ